MPNALEDVVDELQSHFTEIELELGREFERISTTIISTEEALGLIEKINFVSKNPKSQVNLCNSIPRLVVNFLFLFLFVFLQK